MALPWTPEWRADWNRLTAQERDALECQYDASVPHSAVLDTIRMRPVAAVTVDPMIEKILQDYGIVPKAEE